VDIYAVDQGFGLVKGVGPIPPPKGPKVQFPAIVGAPVDPRFDGHLLGDLEQDGRMRVRLGKFKLDRQVGRAALFQSEAKWAPRVRQRSDEDVILLVAAALIRLGVKNGDTIGLVVGLPVAHYDVKEKARLQDLLCRFWEVNSVGFRVSQVAVMPQPAGTVFSQAFTPSGEVRDISVLRSMVGVIDWGHGTTDGLIFNQGRYVEKAAITVPRGVGNVLEAVARYLSDEYRMDVAPFELSQELQQGFAIVQGLHVDLKPVIARAVEIEARAILEPFRERWQHVLGLERVFISGGGSHLFFEASKRAFPQAERVASPIFANAAGFRAWAHFAWRESP